MATNGIDKLYADLGIERPKTVRSYLKDTSSFSFQAAEVMDKYRREEEQRIKDLAEGKVRTSPASSLRTLTPTRRTTVPQATTKARAQVVGNGSLQPTPTPTVGSTVQALGGSLAKGAVNLVRQVATSQIAGQSILRRGLQTMFETPVLDIRKNIPEQVIGAGKKLWEQNKEEITKAQQTSPTVQGLQSAETAVKNWADVENEAGVTKFFAGLAESAPQSLVTAIPIVGWTMLGSSAFLNGLEQAKTEAEVAGQDPNSDKVMLRALGNMGVEIGTESLFGMFKPIGKAVGGTSLANATRGFFDSVSAKLFKSTGKQVSELSAKTVWKQIAQQATEEGVEEVFAELGNALVLKATTDPNAAMPVFNDYLLAFAGGAFMGGAVTGARGAIARHNLRKLKNFQKALAANSEQTIPELVNNPAVVEALNEDIKDPEVQDAILESQLETIKRYGEQEASQVAEIKRMAREMLEPTVEQYVPTEEEMAASGLPAEWYDQLNAPVQPSPVQAPTSPLQTQDTSMPTQTQEAPTPAPQTAASASEAIPKVSIEPVTTEEVMTDVDRYELVTSEKDGKKTQKYITKTTKQPMTKVNETAFSIQAKKQTEEWRNKGFQSIPDNTIDGVKTDYPIGTVFFNDGGIRPSIIVGKEGKDTYIVVEDGSYTTRDKQTIDLIAQDFQQSGAQEMVDRYNYMANVSDKVPSSLQKRFDEQEQKSAQIPTQAQPIPPRPKTVPAQAKKAPEVRMKDMIAKHVSKQDVSKDIEQWVDTEEGQALVGKFKNAEDLGAEIMRLKADIQGTTVTTDEDIAHGYLQLLAYKTWLSRIENAPEGSALSSYMLNMVEAMREGKPKDVQKKLERSVKDSDLFHAVLANQELINKAERKVAEAALTDGGFEKLGQDLADKMGNIKVDLTPENVLLISMYSKMLMERGDIVHAARVLKNLSFRMTQAGRFINAAGVAYKYLFPEYQARAIEKEFNRFIEPEQEQQLDEKVKVTVGVVSKTRKDSAKEAIKETESDLQKPTPEQQKEELTLAQRFAKLLENSLKERKAVEPSADVLLLRRLFAKYKDINKTMKQAFPKSVFEVMTDIIANRSDYREVWEGAQDLLAKNPDMENVDIIQAFIKTAADPVAAKRFMDSVILKNVKTMDKSMSQMARAYFFTGEESFDGFIEKLKENMPNLDAASMNYLSRGIKAFFVAQMNQRRQATIDALKKQIARRTARKEDIDAQQAFINKMMDATYRDALSIPELQDLWAERIGVPHLSQENIQDIYQTMRDMAKMKTENEKNNAYDALAARLANSIPASAMDKFLAWTRTAMLLNPTTWVRNMLSNLSVTPMYRVSDKIANQMQKTIGVPVEMRLADKSVRRFDATTELGKLVYERTSAKEVDRIMRSSSKYSIAQLMGMERRIFKSNTIEKITKMPGRVMNEGDIFGLKGTYLGDLPMFTKHYRYAMYNKLAALSYSPSMTETQKATRINEASDYARDYAAVRTFRDRTALSKLITNLGSKVHTNAEIKNADAATAARMIRENKAIKLLVKVVVPFSNTPAAIMREAYRFSPLKMAVSLAKVAFKQKKMKSTPSYAIQVTNELAQSTVGSFASFGLGVVLSMLGVLTGPPPENEKEKVAWELEGKRSYSLYIPGFGSLSVDWLQPFSTGLMMGAAVVQASKDPEGVLDWLGKASTSMIDAMLANTIIDSVQRQFGASYKSSLEKLRDIGLSALYQSLPGLIKRMNQVIDPYVRDAYSGSAATQVFNRVVSSLPFGTLLVPIKVDIWGNKVTQAHVKDGWSIVERSAMNLVLPFIKTKAHTDEVTKSVIDTWNATKTTLGNVALPSVPDKSFSVKDGDTKYEYSLSGKEYAEYQEIVGKLYYEKAKGALSTATSQMEYEANAKALEQAYEDARYEAKWEWHINHPQK